MSETDFVDSTSAMLVIALTAAPTSGSCTNTTSPRASWAKSVIPTRARPPSTATHSCSFVYRNRSGSSMSGCLSQNLADATGVLLGELAGVLVALPFGPYVGQRFLGIGQHEGPAVGMQHLDPVHEHDVTGAGALDHLAHDRSLALPGCRHRLVGDVQSRQALDDRRQGSIGGGEQIEQLDEGGGAVERRHEVGPDEATVLGGGEFDIAR